MCMCDSVEHAVSQFKCNRSDAPRVQGSTQPSLRLCDCWLMDILPSLISPGHPSQSYSVARLAEQTLRNSLVLSGQ